MNRRSPLLALVAAGCGANATTPTTTAITIEHTKVAALGAAPELDLDNAARMWRALAPTGANYQERLAMLPDDDELRRSMAHAMLRQGDFACNAFVEEYGCGDPYDVLEPLDPAATLEDPCLRRYLALWSLEQLEPDDVVALSEVMVELASMASPEYELPEAAFLRATDDAMRLRMLAVAEASNAESWAPQLETNEARIRALTDLHIESVASTLDVAGHEDVLRSALVDPALGAYTRGALLDGFATDDDVRTTRALNELTGDDDCALAMSAATMLAERGDRSHLPTRPRSQNPEAHLRVLCMLNADGAAADTWPQWIAAGGYDSTTVAAYGSYDETTDAYTPPEATTERVLREDAFDERAAATSWTCDGLTCRADQGWRTVSITFDPADDSLVIAEISSQEYEGGGCGC